VYALHYSTLERASECGLKSAILFMLHITIGTCPYTDIPTDRYSEKSDVWAFGVTAWEILSEGAIPYFELTQDTQVVTFVCKGGRLSRDELVVACSDALWGIVCSCWEQTPESRPAFNRLALLLATTMGDAMPSKVPQHIRAVQYIVIVFFFFHQSLLCKR
jgi:hypothetical protein